MSLEQSILDFFNLAESQTNISKIEELTDGITFFDLLQMQLPSHFKKIPYKPCNSEIERLLNLQQLHKDLSKYCHDKLNFSLNDFNLRVSVDEIINKKDHKQLIQFCKIVLVTILCGENNDSMISRMQMITEEKQVVIFAFI